MLKGQRGCLVLRQIAQIGLLIAACCAPVACAEVKPMVGVYYFPGWYRGGGVDGSPASNGNTEWSEWRGAVMKGASPRALCGFADDSKPALWDYFSAWMTSSGIDFIAFDWYYNDAQEYLQDSLDKGFLGSVQGEAAPGSERFGASPKFCLHWCNHGGSWWVRKLDQTPPKLEKMIDLACEKYFNRPNYLKIDGKPVFMIYENDMLSSFGDVKTALSTIRKQARKHGYADLYLVGVYSGASRGEIEKRKEQGYDAFCAYTYCWMRGPSISWQSKTFDYKDITDNIVERVHPYLARVAREENIAYWPSTFSGWDDRPRAGLEKALVLKGSTPAEFGRMLRSAIKHIDPASPVVMVEAWNEWGEGAAIEPSKEHGFGFLREIARAVSIVNPDQTLPSEREIARWSILTPEELKTSRENESKPWPVKPIIYNKLGKSREVAPVKLPVVLDFAEGGVEFGCNDLTIDKRDAQGLWITTTGNDSQIAMPIKEIPTSQIRRITLEAEVTAPASGQLTPPELYIATALLPEYSPFASFLMPPIKDGQSSCPTSDIMFWDTCGTPLTMIRIDPCGQAGVKFHLKRLVMSAE